VVSDCCSSTELHGELAELLKRYNVNDYAASVKVYAVKPQQDAVTALSRERPTVAPQACPRPL